MYTSVFFFLHSEYVKRSSWCNEKSIFKQKLSARVNQRRSKVNEKINVTWTCLRVIVSSMIVRTFRRVQKNSKEVFYLPWQNKYSDLNNTCHIKPNIFLRTKKPRECTPWKISYICRCGFNIALLMYHILDKNHHYNCKQDCIIVI